MNSYKNINRNNRKLNEKFVKFTGNWNKDTEQWYDDLSDASEKYFKNKKSIPMFETLIDFAKNIEAGKFKPTDDKLKVLKILANSLPKNSYYDNFKSFIDQLDKFSYKKDFRKFEGSISVISELFSFIRQSVLYSENELETMFLNDIEDDKIIALAQHLEMTAEKAIDNIKRSRYDNNLYTSDGTDYLVCTDEEADEEAEEKIKISIEEFGIKEIDNWKKYIDENWFMDFYEKHYQEYIEDIIQEKHFKYGNRLIAELYDEGIIDDADFEKNENGDYIYNESSLLVDLDIVKDEYANLLLNSIDDVIDKYEQDFGEEDLFYEISDYKLYNEDKLIQNSISKERGWIMGAQGGSEYEEKVYGEYYYIYKLDY